MTGAVEPRVNLAALTGVRGIAAWFVVLYHVRQAAAAQLPAGVIDVFAKGYLAVDFFFMLSGFVLWLNYGGVLRREGLAAAPHFLSRRVARIWPLHLFILAGAVLFAAIMSAAGKPDPENFPWHELPLHILLIQNWGLTEQLSWNVPAWSISCELAAYLLFPILVLAFDWRRLSSVALVALALAIAGGLHLSFAAAGETSLGADIPRFGLGRAVAEFTIGTILCALWLRWREAPGWPVTLSLAAAAALTIAALAGLLPETLAVPALFGALLLAVALTADRRSNPLGWRPVHYLGEISYATYLVHFLLYVAFKLLFVADASAVPLPLLGLFLLMTLLASVALYHGVERPAQRLLNRAYDAAAGRLSSRHPSAERA
jgi:peptidoglycan/LPS O-acetylase OafA/YrhL